MGRSRLRSKSLTARAVLWIVGTLLGSAAALPSAWPDDPDSAFDVRRFLSQGWDDRSTNAGGQPTASLVRPKPRVLETTSPLVIAKRRATGTVETKREADFSLADMISGRTPPPRPTLIRPNRPPISVPLLTPTPRKPIELVVSNFESPSRVETQDVTEPDAKISGAAMPDAEMPARRPAPPTPGPALQALEGMLLQDELESSWEPPTMIGGEG